MKTKLKHIRTSKWSLLAPFFMMLCIWFLSLPQPLFDVDYATIVRARNGEILAGSIAEDGQWRFPETDTIPYKFKICITQFEDAYFDTHIGVNPISIAKALWDNLASGKVVRGGSTITMQLARLQQGHAPRTYIQKIKEVFLALRIELSFSKGEILKLYAAHAPFGGNVVGLSSASNRYFRISSSQLSWAQAATLAVLPNQPGLIYPGRNKDHLKRKRNRLLTKLLISDFISQFEYELALLEPLPSRPFPLSRVGKHLLNRVKKEQLSGKDITTTVSADLQRQCTHILDHRMEVMAATKIFNGAILVLDNNSGNVLAYVGNSNSKGAKGQEVDIIQSRRSTGSVLKPFLYLSMLNDGLLLPRQLIKDVPVYYNGFHPQNYHKDYVGVVAADDALARSLNVPAVILLDDYKVPRFKKRLNQLGIHSIDRPADYYGLSLILGGAESSLWQMSGAYASLARVANNYWQRSITPYSKDDFHAPQYLLKNENDKPLKGRGKFDAASIWYMFEAMSKVYRPEEDALWKTFESARKIAWKTGTSYGHRDAWAIGVTPRYTVGVWVGNADGEGRPGLTGASCAAPIMFDVFNYLPYDKFWAEFPYDETIQALVCRTSGHLAGIDCPEKDTLYVSERGIQKAKNCAYHLKYWVNSEGERVHRICSADLSPLVHFKLPPVEAYYYKRHHPQYKQTPVWSANCRGALKEGVMKMIYPRWNSSIIIPKELEGNKGQAIFKVAHSKSGRTVFWYLDEQLIGQTQKNHQLGLAPQEGEHLLYLIDNKGAELYLSFEVK